MLLQQQFKKNLTALLTGLWGTAGIDHRWSKLHPRRQTQVHKNQRNTQCLWCTTWFALEVNWTEKLKTKYNAAKFSDCDSIITVCRTEFDMCIWITLKICLCSKLLLKADSFTINFHIFSLYMSCILWASIEQITWEIWNCEISFWVGPWMQHGIARELSRCHQHFPQVTSVSWH